MRNYNRLCHIISNGKSKFKFIIFISFFITVIALSTVGAVLVQKKEYDFAANILFLCAIAIVLIGFKWFRLYVFPILQSSRSVMRYGDESIFENIDSIPLDKSIAPDIYVYECYIFDVKKCVAVKISEIIWLHYEKVRNFSLIAGKTCTCVKVYLSDGTVHYIGSELPYNNYVKNCESIAHFITDNNENVLFGMSGDNFKTYKKTLKYKKNRRKHNM